MAKKRKKTWTARELREALRQRYGAPAWAFMEEVRDSTGFTGAGRSADAVAMSLWPSRGLDIHGFEIKCSRSDWLKELRDPKKARAIMRYCDFWWVVAGRDDLVDPAELPSTWGLIVPKNNRLQTVTKAPRLEPEPLDRGFVAALVRRAYEQTVDHAELDKARTEGRKAGAACVQVELDRLRESVKAFEGASGVRIDRYREGEIGEAVRMVREGKHLNYRRSLEHMRRSAETLLKRLDEALKDPPPAAPVVVSAVAMEGFDEGDGGA